MFRKGLLWYFPPVTWRSALVLTVTIVSWLRAINAFLYWSFLSKTIGQWQTLYLALSGIIWGCSGILLLVIVWRRLSASERWMALAALLYGIWYWSERLWTRSDTGNFGFAILLTLLIESIFWLPLIPHFNFHASPKDEPHER